MQTPEQKRAWRAANKEKLRAQSTAWRKSNPERVKELKRQFYARHKEEIRQKQDVWRTENREAVIQRQRDHYRCNAEKINETARLRRQGVDRAEFNALRRARRKAERARFLLAELRKRAKDLGVPFDIDAQWLSEKIGNGVCELSGIPFDHETPRGDYSMSIDRIDPRGGYTKANVKASIWFLNRAFCDMGKDEAFDIFEQALRKARPEIFR